MTITRAAYKKWTKITLICGAHSFVWGALTNGSILAMLLGLLTLITLFAFIESHPVYQSKRAAAPRLARALDGGVRFRLWFAGYVVLSYAFLFAFGGTATQKPFTLILLSGYMAELYIGMGATAVTHFLTGWDISGTSRGPVDAYGSSTYTWIENVAATYTTTITTGLIHTVILGVICLMAYGVIRLRGGDSKAPVDGQASE
jgi:hypothetical protein